MLAREMLNRFEHVVLFAKPTERDLFLTVGLLSDWINQRRLARLRVLGCRAIASNSD